MPFPVEFFPPNDESEILKGLSNLSSAGRRAEKTPEAFLNQFQV